VRVSSAAAEACIALSLALLALDARKRAASGALAGAGMAFVFGLVHGLGFAGGPREIGVPERAAGAALVGFGAGVEIGQVAFLAIVGLLHALGRVRAVPKDDGARRRVRGARDLRTVARRSCLDRDVARGRGFVLLDGRWIAGLRAHLPSP
jgi:hypothetical protein